FRIHSRRTRGRTAEALETSRAPAHGRGTLFSAQQSSAGTQEDRRANSRSRRAGGLYRTKHRSERRGRRREDRRRQGAWEWLGLSMETVPGIIQDAWIQSFEIFEIVKPSFAAIY